jgi:hypothetical protein
MSANILGSTNEAIEMAPEKTEIVGLYAGDEESEIVRNVEPTDGELQSSSCCTRKKIIWGSIISCIIIAAAVAVPCVLLLGGSSGSNSSNFPKLSNAKNDELFKNIPEDICHESLPKSGVCAPIDSVDAQQGGDLCNLVAKTMINTTVYGDIALINAGVCKQTLLAPTLTAGDMKAAIAEESLVVVEISGFDLVNILTEALTTTFGRPEIPEAYPYASGLRYSVEANLPPSQMLSEIEVNRGLRADEWEPIDIRRFYKVITTETLASGGMDYASFNNVVAEWKDPLDIKTGDAFYNYAKENCEDHGWSVLPKSEYSTQYFVGKYEEPSIAMVPSRICHALIPGQPESSFCTTADVLHGGEVCNLVSWAIYDQTFGIDMVMLKGDSCAGDIAEGDFVESSFETILSENKALVTADLLGSKIVALLDNSVTLAVTKGLTGNYPYAAGLKFDVSKMLSPKVSNVQYLTSNGSWSPIVATETYTVATTSDLINSSTQNMGTTIKDEIISYATDWEKLYKTPSSKASTQSYT